MRLTRADSAERDARIKELEARVHELEHPTPKTVRAMCMRDGAYHSSIWIDIPEGTKSIVDFDGKTLFISAELLESIGKL